jgi:VanZ family protein
MVVLSWLGTDLLTGAIWTAALVLVFAVLDEIHQSFVPHRDASGFDVLLDMIGLGLGVGSTMIFLALRRSHRR